MPSFSSSPTCRAAIGLSLLAGSCATTVHAAGFQLFEQNASGLGNAYAGSAAVAENASTIYYNPAGMTELPGVNVTAGANAIWPSFKFTDDGRSRNPLAVGGRAPTGGNGGNAGHLGVVPNASVSWQLDPKWHVGIGVGVPFGLMTRYETGWAGQFHSKKFDIKTVNINPAIAYRVSDQISLGAGVNWQRIQAEYTKQQVVGVGRSTTADVNMHGDAWGWNAGVLIKATPATKIGLSYRSKLKQSARGHTELDGVGHYDARTRVDLPDTAILSIAHALTPRWEILGDVSWTGWSSIPELKIKHQGLPDDTLDLRFRNAWRYAVGANYKVDDAWTLRLGVAYDQSPVHEDNRRPTALPDNDRIWLSTGVQFRASKRTTVDVGYAYLRVKKTRIDNDGENALTRGRVSGKYAGRGNIVGVQLTSRF